MGCLIALGSLVVVFGIFFVVWYVWGMTGFWILAGLIVFLFLVLLITQGGEDTDDYYDD